ncbi:hypothetical protein J6590_076316 [Homalodisca vitripennis]|nr:hypothetical protein J6590_076316 [Homalodisca vitripennis]
MDETDLCYQRSKATVGPGHTFVTKKYVYDAGLLPAGDVCRMQISPGGDFGPACEDYPVQYSAQLEITLPKIMWLVTGAEE